MVKQPDEPRPVEQPAPAGPSGPSGQSLASWKEIANFLRRDVRTVQRWEKEEGLPVRRHLHLRRHSVYADPQELEVWWHERGAQLKTDHRFRGNEGRRWLALAAAAAPLVAVLIVWIEKRTVPSLQDISASFGGVVAAGRPLITPGSLAVSPDGATLYISDWGARAIFAVASEGGQPKVLTSLQSAAFAGLDNARFVALSPDGSTLYAAGWATGSVFAISTATGAAKLLTAGPPLDRPHGVAVSPEGSTVYVTDNFGGKVFRLPAAGGAPVLLASALPEPLDVATSGSRLFVVSGNGEVYSMSDMGGDPARLVSTGPMIRPTGITLSPDGSTLFIVDDAGFGGRPPAAIYALPVAGGRPSLVYAGPPLLFPADCALSGDGGTLFIADAGYKASGAIYRLNLFDPLAIDIKPNQDNVIDPTSEGVISVAVLSTGPIDPSEIDPLSARFGPRSASESHGRGHREDVNGDGRPDLLLHFVVARTGLTCGSTEASLRVRTFDGRRLMGSDAVLPGGCR